MTCPKCHGRGGLDCEGCGGMGAALIHRCPQSQTSGEAVNALRAYQAWDKGIPPSAGGSCDQSAVFHDVVNVIQVERALINEATEGK